MSSNKYKSRFSHVTRPSVTGNTNYRTPGNVPFSWEHKPGVSKVSPDDEDHEYGLDTVNDDGGGGGGGGVFAPKKLPPPPCHVLEENGKANNKTSQHHDLQIPLPPCAFQPPPPPPPRSSSKKGFKKSDDPFLIAFKECTKTSGKDRFVKGAKEDYGLGLKKNMPLFSCKHSCNVVDDSVIRVSQVSISKSQRDRERLRLNSK